MQVKILVHDLPKNSFPLLIKQAMNIQTETELY